MNSLTGQWSGGGKMNEDSVHISVILSIILIIVGGISLLYGFVIPLTFLPKNILPSMIFKIIGILFILIGLISTFIQLRRKTSRKIQRENKNISP
jgi:cytochrome b subunit of formate dehydrogenase